MVHPHVMAGPPFRTSPTHPVSVRHFLFPAAALERIRSCWVLRARLRAETEEEQQRAMQHLRHRTMLSGRGLSALLLGRRRGCT